MDGWNHIRQSMNEMMPKRLNKRKEIKRNNNRNTLKLISDLNGKIKQG